MGGDYGYGGAINSGLAELTIKLVGNNTIHAELEQWGTTYRDSINSGTNCDVKIVSGATDGTTPTLICDLIDMGRGGSGFTGGAGEGNLTVDGVNLTVNDRIFVHHNTTFQKRGAGNCHRRPDCQQQRHGQSGWREYGAYGQVHRLGQRLVGTDQSVGAGFRHPHHHRQRGLSRRPRGDTNPYAIRFDPFPPAASPSTAVCL